MNGNEMLAMEQRLEQALARAEARTMEALADGCNVYVDDTGIDLEGAGFGFGLFQHDSRSGLPYDRFTFRYDENETLWGPLEEQVERKLEYWLDDMWEELGGAEA